MAEFLIGAYILYLVGLGQVWYRFLARPLRWRWTHLAWSFGLGTILWAYTLFMLNILNLSTFGGRLYMWQGILIVIPLIGDALFRLPVQAVMTSSPVRPVR